jgi:Uma2 family endonuclease
MHAMEPAPQLLTAEDLARMPDYELYELDRGRLVPLMLAGRPHGELTVRLTVRIHTFVETHDLGVVYSNDTGFIVERNPDTVRGPDIAFVGWDKYEPSDESDTLPWGKQGPDLAVEVKSPSNTAAELNRKAEQYLNGGTRLVWLVNGQKKEVVVHAADRSVKVLRPGDVLDGEDVLPGFQLSLDELFRKRYPPRRPEQQA